MLKFKNIQTEPNSCIHLLYLSNGTACADAFVDSNALLKSWFVTGPGDGIALGSA